MIGDIISKGWSNIKVELFGIFFSSFFFQVGYLLEIVFHKLSIYFYCDNKIEDLYYINFSKF